MRGILPPKNAGRRAARRGDDRLHQSMLVDGSNSLVLLSSLLDTEKVCVAEVLLQQRDSTALSLARTMLQEM
jgi:hypothetical protein